MSWFILCALILMLGLALAVLLHRRAELRDLDATLGARAEAKAQGSHAARLQYPHIDLSRCVGCATCIKACPEDGVLGLVHGQAVVVHGARCVGHGLCADACPVGAIQVTLGDLSKRSDIPVLSESLEAEGVPGLFLAGEVTGYALVRTAMTHGRTVAEQVARRVGAGLRPDDDEALDLCIVGAGPAGLSCSLAAKERGLRFITLEQEALGGSVAKYPRRKLVMTQPVELPLYGRLTRTSYPKEDLVELWERIAGEHRLPIETGEELVGLERDERGIFEVRTKTRTVRARHVALCLGRRGTPRKLGVPGEELAKVAYSLIDAESYRGRRILVVGGGDSAVEAAVALAEQPGNEVHLSYRKESFFRIKARNRANLERKQADGALSLLLGSEVKEIRKDRVVLSQARDGGARLIALRNDEVFVFAGGVPPFELLERARVSFDPAMRPPVAELGERGTGLVRALAVGLALTVATLAWALAFRDYYALPAALRLDSGRHELLRPTGRLGLTLGISACALIAVNLLYLLRRSSLGERIAGSLRHWLSIHVLTGLLALLVLLLHGGMEVRDTPGGHAFVAVLVLVVSGAIGRYLYSYIPKAANGAELALEEVQGSLAGVLSELDREGRAFGEAVKDELAALQAGERWRRSLPRRLAGLLGSRRRLRATLARIERAARGHGVADRQVHRLLTLARKVHDTSVMTAHYEDLRGLLSSWRFVHRWIALAMVLLAGLHIVVALRYATFG